MNASLFRNGAVSGLLGLFSSQSPLGDIPMVLLLAAKGVQSPLQCMSKISDAQASTWLINMACSPLSEAGVGAADLNSAVLIGLVVMGVLFVFFTARELASKK